MPSNNAMDPIFLQLNQIIETQARIIKQLADHIEQLENIGGGGSASIEDYESGKVYKRNTLVVDRNTETVYRAKCDVEYTSVTIEADRQAGNLKLVGFESSIVTFDHPPFQDEVDALPEDTLVAVYSPSDNPYQAIVRTDHVESEDPPV